MAMLRCRACGAEIASDDKRRKCMSCGELFPFACAICDKHLRPPIPDFPVEKFFTDDHQPLCQEHYQRECPECKRWFRADENPGFYMCRECTAARDQQAGAENTTSSVSTLNDDLAPESIQATSPLKRIGCFASLLLVSLMGALLLGSVAFAGAFFQSH